MLFRSASAHGHQTWEAYIADDNGSQEVEVTSTREVNRLETVLTNHNLDTVLRNRMNDEEEQRYDYYNLTYGNRDYLFDVNTLPSAEVPVVLAMKFRQRHCQMKNLQT